MSTGETMTIDERLRRAIGERGELLSRLHGEETDCYRLLHGVAEGLPGVTIDRYGPILLLQTWCEPDDHDFAELLEPLRQVVRAELGVEVTPVWNHRAKQRDEAFDTWHTPEAVARPTGTEFGLVYDVSPRHRGIDPLLFLDLRAGRRRVLEEAAGRTVLNLFAYTCSLGIVALAGQAHDAWNVDFSATALSVGRGNANRNGVRSRVKTIHEDVIPIMRQFAGLPITDRRGGKKLEYVEVEKRQFDLVILDPPAWSKGSYGAVDVTRDYPSLFKPALLITRRGGRMLVTNNAARVDLEDWLAVLRRCAEKAGRPLRDVEVIEPEADFPSFDGRHPLKMAWITV